MKGIADTGFLVAFANRADEYHDWAVSVAEQVIDPLLTCEPVLAEARSQTCRYELPRVSEIKDKPGMIWVPSRVEISEPSALGG